MAKRQRDILLKGFEQGLNRAYQQAEYDRRRELENNDFLDRLKIQAEAEEKKQKKEAEQKELETERKTKQKQDAYNAVSQMLEPKFQEPYFKNVPISANQRNLQPRPPQQVTLDQSGLFQEPGLEELNQIRYKAKMLDDIAGTHTFDIVNDVYNEAVKQNKVDYKIEGGNLYEYRYGQKPTLVEENYIPTRVRNSATTITKNKKGEKTTTKRTYENGELVGTDITQDTTKEGNNLKLYNNKFLNDLWDDVRKTDDILTQFDAGASVNVNGVIYHKDDKDNPREQVENAIMAKKALFDKQVDKLATKNAHDWFEAFKQDTNPNVKRPSEVKNPDMRDFVKIALEDYENGDLSDEDFLWLRYKYLSLYGSYFEQLEGEYAGE